MVIGRDARSLRPGRPLSEINRGPIALAKYILADCIRNRRKFVH